MSLAKTDPGLSVWPAACQSIVGAGVVLSRSEPLALAASARAFALLRREFPHVPWVLAGDARAPAVVIDEEAWRELSSDLYRWDATVLALSSRRSSLLISASGSGETTGETLVQALTRYQRLAPRVNDASRSDAFQRALSLHRQLHDLGKPLVRADYEHALDVWQWVLRLEPRASRALQLAALFHDVERLTSEADKRIEHEAADYQAFKNAHAQVGARVAAKTSSAAGVELADCARVAELIREHELPARGAREAEAEALADADALSFFSLNSPGFADHYGPEHTQKKVRYSLRRMSKRAIARLGGVKLRVDIERHVVDAGYGGLFAPGKELSQ